MSSQSRSSKTNKSSIKCWWVPLEVQSFESDNICPPGDVNSHPNSHSKNNRSFEAKSPSNRFSTPQLASAVVGLWDCVGNPAVFQTKTNFKHGEICNKKNNICYSDSGKHSSAESIVGESMCKDLTSRGCFSSTAKSNFEDLKAMKRMIFFASCNKNIDNCSIWNRSLSGIDSSGIDKASHTGVTNDITNNYASIVMKPFFGYDGTDESLTNEAKSSPTDRSPMQGTQKNATAEGENSSGGKSKKLAETMLQPHSSLFSTYPLDRGTRTKDTIIISSSISGLYSDDNIALLNSADWGLLKCQQSTDSSCMTVESSAEVSASKDDIVHGNNKKITCDLIGRKDCFPKHWPSVQDKLQLAFAKNKHALAGALAGTLVSLCLHPIDTVKTIIQANAVGQKSSYHILKTVISEKGVTGLYRGIATNIASSAPISAIYTYTYESVKGSLLPILPKEYHSVAHCIAGGCSSIATSFIFTPSERIKQQMQVGSQYPNCWSALIGSVEKGGVRSLYSGWGAVLCRNIPHSIIKFYTYERLKQLLLKSAKPNANLSTLQTLLCGGVAGSTAALFTTPFDVVKARLQTQVPGSLAKYDGVLHALQEISRLEGLQGLYRGLTPRLAMYVSQGAIFFASYEFLKAAFSLEASRAPVQIIEKQKHKDNLASSKLQKLKA